MKQKNKNGKKLSTLEPEEAFENFLWPWPHLPPSLIQPPHTNRHRTPAGTTKSWPTTSYRCKSMQPHGQRLHLHYPTANNNTPPPPSQPRSRYFHDGAHIDQVISQRDDASYWRVIKPGPAVETQCHAARMAFIPPSNLQDPVVSVGVALENGAPSSTLMVYYRLHHSNRYRNAQIRHECATVDPFDVRRKRLVFTSIVRCGGKFYAMSVQGALAVMQVVDWRLRMTAVSAARAMPSASSRCFSEYLLEMEGEVFVVFLIHEKSTEMVDHVEVLRLGFAEVEWIKVERVGGKKVFVGECSVNWAGSGEIGCRGDCVYYFTQGLDDRRSWWVYDMVSGRISPTFWG